MPGAHGLLAGTGHRLGVNGFPWDSPAILLGGPLIALVLNLWSQVRPRVDRNMRAFILTGVEFRPNAAGIAVIIAATAGLAVLMGYPVFENLAHL